METIYYMKTDNCKIAGAYFIAWLFSDGVIQLESSNRMLATSTHLHELRAKGFKVERLYEDVAEHKEKVAEICKNWDITPEELDK